MPKKCFLQLPPIIKEFLVLHIKGFLSSPYSRTFFQSVCVLLSFILFMIYSLALVIYIITTLESISLEFKKQVFKRKLVFAILLFLLIVFAPILITPEKKVILCDTKSLYDSLGYPRTYQTYRTLIGNDEVLRIKYTPPKCYISPFYTNYKFIGGYMTLRSLNKLAVTSG